ncbi:uncharacterized protein LOC110821742 isoform X2 [Carica papaya]|uniref:uncharacterized protein LOC110821742 isoform X2 n=1 Tax=Carica papaya TaxID=3649 RepID=UPI000B8C7905|nr:uncharacterized protein LOC110821742 isoform X2 [Carica papaya]
MSIRFRHLRKILRILPQIRSGSQCEQSREYLDLLASSPIRLLHSCKNFNTGFSNRGYFAHRFSTASLVSQDSSPIVDVLSLIESTFDELQGPSHHWLNKDEGNKDFFKREGTFLVIVGQFLDNAQISGCDPSFTFEKVKLLQQRFPQLHVIGVQSGSQACFDADHSKLLQWIMKDFLTFPILSSNKISEMINGACCILFKDFQNPVIYHEKDLDVGILSEAIEVLTAQDSQNSKSRSIFTNRWSKQVEAIKEPRLFMQDLFLYFPGCVSADEKGNRLFLSDSNHHRIIVFDNNGKILDCIGSCPGFEDGEFESAKLLRPAASFYHDTDDCLYIVDSENHAIRRADMERRVLETLYPSCSSDKKNNGLWSWIMDKLGVRRDGDTKPKEFDLQSLIFPWHMLKLENNSFLIINKSFEYLWIMDLNSGEIKEAVEGFPKIWDICGQLIMEKVSFLKQIPCDWLQQLNEAACSPRETPYTGLVSSFTTFQNQIIMCDIVGQRLLKLNSESGICSNMQFSNFGVLGLPYWLPLPLERVCSEAHGLKGTQPDHVQCFRLFPGRTDIQLNIDLPVYTELVEPIQEGCIWCQARGAAAEISGAERAIGSLEKVGAAQQWYDDLDNLAFSTPESELTIEDADVPLDMKSGDEQVHINCAVNTSPGSSEQLKCLWWHMQ